MTFTATTFYTNDYYLEQTKILGVSCKKYEVPLIVTKADDRGSWVKNCAYKAYYIYDMLMTIKTDVVWLDSDSQIVKYPELFGSIKEDFAVRAEPGKKTKKPVGREQISLPDNWPTDIDPCWFNSGTIFFKNTDKTKELCRRWLQLCTKNETDWDQWTLQQAWCDIRPNTYWLPREYCQIKKLWGTNGAVILHELASVAQKVNRT
jgi:Nucleotide-diphospho-sugar transferase